MGLDLTEPQKLAYRVMVALTYYILTLFLANMIFPNTPLHVHTLLA